MPDVAKINSGAGIKKTGGVYATAKSAATVDDRVYDTDTALGAGAQNAGGNATIGYGTHGSGLTAVSITGTCLAGDGTSVTPLYVKLNPTGNIVCTPDGLLATVTSSSGVADTYYVGENDNGNSGASKTISFATQAFQKLTLTANATLTFTAPSGARSTKIRFVQGGSGGYTPVLPGGTSGALPTIASGVGASTVVNFYYDGSTWHV